MSNHTSCIDLELEFAFDDWGNLIVFNDLRILQNMLIAEFLSMGCIVDISPAHIEVCKERNVFCRILKSDKQVLRMLQSGTKINILDISNWSYEVSSKHFCLKLNTGHYNNIQTEATLIYIKFNEENNDLKDYDWDDFFNNHLIGILELLYNYYDYDYDIITLVAGVPIITTICYILYLYIHQLFM